MGSQKNFGEGSFVKDFFLVMCLWETYRLLNLVEIFLTTSFTALKLAIPWKYKKVTPTHVGTTSVWFFMNLKLSAKANLSIKNVWRNVMKTRPSLFHMQEFQKQLTCLLPPLRWQLALLQKISANLAEWSQWFFRPRKSKTHWQNIRQRRAEQRVLHDSGVCLQFLGKSRREGVNFGDVKSKWYWKEIPFDTSLIPI